MRARGGAALDGRVLQAGRGVKAPAPVSDASVGQNLPRRRERYHRAWDGATTSDTSSVVTRRSSRRCCWSSKGQARCIVARLSQITRSPTRQAWRYTRSGRVANDQGFEAAIFNPAAFGTGYPALVAAISQVKFPTTEVHISNPIRRGPASQTAVVSQSVVAGFGIAGYALALRGIRDMLAAKK